jgi:hypothetical protein
VATQVAQRPLTGFCLTVGVSLLRDVPDFFYAPGARAALQTFGPARDGSCSAGLGNGGGPEPALFRCFYLSLARIS